MDSEPCCAALSPAPGSPVTYRPRMPSAAPAPVMSISEFSTVAGASCPESFPCPCASKPTASTPQSTSGTPRICSIWSRGSPCETSTVSQPCLRAWAGQPVLVEVADDHHRCAQQLRRYRGRDTDGSGAGYVDGRTGLGTSGVGTVEAGGEDVRQYGQVGDLLQRLVPVREHQQVPVRVRDPHVLGLAADPAAHVDVAVRRPGPIGVDVQADPDLAVPAPPAGDVERHRADVAHLDELHARADLDHLAGDLMAEHEPFGSGGPGAHHVLVGATDVGRHDLQDGAVRDFASDVGGVDARAVFQFSSNVG